MNTERNLIKMIAASLCLLAVHFAPSPAHAGDTCLAGPTFTADFDFVHHQDGFDADGPGGPQIVPVTYGVEESFADTWEYAAGLVFVPSGSGETATRIHGAILGGPGADILGYVASKMELVPATDLAGVTLDTCQSIAWDDSSYRAQSAQMLLDGQIACVANIYNFDGTPRTGGPRYFAVQPNSHAYDGIISTANLTTVTLQSTTTKSCNDGNPCTEDACDTSTGYGEDGTCSSVYNAATCSENLAPCDGPASGSTWSNHGAYQSHLVQQARQAMRNGQITPEQMNEIIRNGASSDCGR